MVNGGANRGTGMGDVNLIIQGKGYPVVCDPGQEGRVNALGRYLDQQVGEIARTGAATEENHLLVLTGLILTDRIDELQTQVNDAMYAAPQLAIPEMVAPSETAASYVDDEPEILAAINQLASRLESVADRLNKV